MWYGQRSSLPLPDARGRSGRSPFGDLRCFLGLFVAMKCGVKIDVAFSSFLVCLTVRRCPSPPPPFPPRSSIISSKNALRQLPTTVTKSSVGTLGHEERDGNDPCLYPLPSDAAAAGRWGMVGEGGGRAGGGAGKQVYSPPPPPRLQESPGPPLTVNSQRPLFDGQAAEQSQIDLRLD